MIIQIPAVEVPSQDENNSPTVVLVPETPIPPNALSVTCDGETYFVQVPGEPEG